MFNNVIPGIRTTFISGSAVVESPKKRAKEDPPAERKKKKVCKAQKSFFL